MEKGKHTTKTVKIGNLKIGSKYPVRIKGMIKGNLENVEEVIKEAKVLEEEGAEAIRVAIEKEKDLKIKKSLEKVLNVPLIADVHFHYKLALRSIEEGFPAIRLNPLNIYKKNEVKEVVKEAKKSKISIRVGVNSGGFRERFSSYQELAKKMVKVVQDYIKILEKENFFDIIVSLKAQNVEATVLANRIFSKKFDYPLQLGITATGPFLEGITKSALGIGMLLYEGIGNCIRVSLTQDSFWEIRVAKYILQALNLREFGPQIISCPTCSRCKVNLKEIVENFEEKLKEKKIDKPIKIAIMGCMVNGPGEAYQADLGVAFGRDKGVIFKKGKILSRCGKEKVIESLVRWINANKRN
jgi:(E)-4-hydroxy-3-methylbut-2-enyl-diphosphate synthase